MRKVNSPTATTTSKMMARLSIEPQRILPSRSQYFL